MDQLNEVKKKLEIVEQFDIELLNKLRDDFQFMTEQMMKKTMQHANKQLQDTLMNYFLENYVSAILKRHLGKSTNRSVREMLDQNLSKDYPKYMSLLIKFEDKIEEVDQIEAYEKMLTSLILDNKDYSVEGADQWKTHTRKRMLALMLFSHLKLKDQREQYPNFFELWKLIYPTNPLPQRVARNVPSGTVSQQTKSPSCSPKNQNGTRIESFETSTQHIVGVQPVSTATATKKAKKNKNPSHDEYPKSFVQPTKSSQTNTNNNLYAEDQAEIMNSKKIKLNNSQEQPIQSYNPFTNDFQFQQQQFQQQQQIQMNPMNQLMVNQPIQFIPQFTPYIYQPQMMMQPNMIQPSFYRRDNFVQIPTTNIPFNNFNYIQQPAMCNFMFNNQTQQLQ